MENRSGNLRLGIYHFHLSISKYNKVYWINKWTSISRVTLETPIDVYRQNNYLKFIKGIVRSDYYQHSENY